MFIMMTSYFYGGTLADEKQRVLHDFVRQNFSKKIVNMCVKELETTMRVECMHLDEMFPRKKKYAVSVSDGEMEGWLFVTVKRSGSRGDNAIAYLRFQEFSHAEDEITPLEVVYSSSTT